MILAIFDQQVVLIRPTKSIGLPFQKPNINFQDCRHSDYLGFPIRMVLAISYLQVALILPSKFLVNWSSDSGEETQNRFSKCGHLGFSIRTISAIFDLQVTQIRPNKSQLVFQFRRRSTK